QAPLGEFGQERESFRKIKIFNYFMNDFGDQLAPLAVRPPDVRPKGPADFLVPRFSVRTNGTEGFVFWNNYVRYYPLPAWTNVQVTVRLPNEVLQIPREPITVPSGAYFIWPFNFDLSGIKLNYSTAQLFTKLTSNGITTYFFVAIPGIAPQFGFDGKTVESIESGGGQTAHDDGNEYVTVSKPGLNAAISLRTKTGAEVKIVVLSQDEAESAWKVNMDGSEHLLFTKQQYFADKTRIYLQSIGDNKFEFQLLPQTSLKLTGSHAIQSKALPDGITGYDATVPARDIRLTYTRIQDAGKVPPVKMGPWIAWRNTAVAEAPGDSAFADAAKWMVTVPDEFPSDLSELFLEAKYYG
ncbi:MAG: hypothetical protein B7X11_05825, partial [Acidobacteria bacterium 37-65-4]